MNSRAARVKQKTEAECDCDDGGFCRWQTRSTKHTVGWIRAVWFFYTMSQWYVIYLVRIVYALLCHLWYDCWYKDWCANVLYRRMCANLLPQFKKISDSLENFVPLLVLVFWDVWWKEKIFFYWREKYVHWDR